MTLDAAAATDDDLILLAREGNSEAFAQIAERHFGIVYSIAYARLGHREAAEDLAQEVFLRAFLYLDRFRQPVPLAGWLARVTKNLASNWNRQGWHSSRLLPMVPIQDLPEEPLDPGAKDGLETMLASEQDQLVRNAILRLPIEQREVILLHFSEGLSQNEIASRLGVFQTTIGRRLKKALKAMKGMLEPVLFENVVRESMQRKSAQSESNDRKPGSPLKPSCAAISRVIALGGATAALSATAKAALLEQAGGAAWLAIASAAATESLLATGKTAALLKTFTTALAAGGKIMTAGKGITAAVVLCALLAIGAYEYEKYPSMKEGKPSGGAEQGSVAKRASVNSPAPKPADDSGLPAQKPDPGKTGLTEYPDTKGEPLWGVTVPTPPWSKTSYHIIADGKTQTDSFNTREPSAPNEQWFETPLASDAKSPRQADSERLQFLYVGKLNRFAMFQSPFRGGVWGIDEFKPLNKEAEDNWRAMAQSPELGRISGIVVDMKHKPIPRARVLVINNRMWEYERTVECNDAGQFTVERLPLSAMEFTARAFGFGLEKVTARIKPGAQSDLIEIVLKSTTPIIGQVTNESGTPLSGAVVEARQANQTTNYAPPEYATDSAVTDKAGRYVLASLPLGSYKVQANLAGHANETRAAELLEGMQPVQVDFVLREGKSVIGRVIRRQHGKDAPVSGVEVMVDVNSRGNFGAKSYTLTCLSDKEGAFCFDALPLGRPIRLHAATREQTFIEAEKTVTLAKDKTPDPVELRLVDTGDIRGRVMDSKGNAIANSEVIYSELEVSTKHESSWSSLNDSPSAITDKDGYFIFDELPVSTHFRFLAKAKGYSPGRSGFTRSDLNEDITIVLGLSHTIQGQVLSADKHNPVAGMNLQCKGDDEQIEKATDSEGRFIFQDLGAGSYHIIGTKIGPDGRWIIEPHSAVIIAQDSETSELLLTAIVSKTIRGKIIERDSRVPLSEADISCFAVRSDNGYPGGRTNSGTDGTFEIEDLPVGEYEISVRKHGYLGIDPTGKINPTPSYDDTRQNVKVTDGEDASVEICLLAGGTVTGVVVDSNGQPVSEVYVRIPSARRNLDAQQTDAKGAFHLTGLPLDGQELEVRARADGYISASNKVALSEKCKTVNLEMVLGSGGSVSGTLTDPKGKPIHGLVFAADAESYSDDLGMYALKGVPPGKCEITARADGYLDKNVKEVQVDAGKESLVNIVMDPGLKIAGTVVDLKGQGLSQVLVDPNEKAFIANSFTTLGSGYFEILDLPEGEIPLRFTLGSWVFRTDGIRPSAQAQIFVLRLGGTLHARLVDPSGNPISATGLSACLTVAPQTPAAKGECALAKSTCTIPLAKPELQISDLPLGVYTLTIRSGATDLKVVKDIEIATDAAVDLGNITIQR